MFGRRDAQGYERKLCATNHSPRTRSLPSSRWTLNSLARNHAMGTPKERQFRRFNLSYTVHVRFHAGKSVAELDVVTRNISIGGLLLESRSPIPYGSQVEFTIRLTGAPITHPITLEGSGRIVRLETDATTRQFGIAIACTRPVDQIQPYPCGISEQRWIN